jgi:DNA invertase Pin-like site-specific DNA recombinase
MSLALIYVRQSDHKRYELTTSPEVQREECRALPAVRGCDEVEVFEDLGKSGGKLKGRAGFRDLLARVQGGGVTSSRRTTSRERSATRRMRSSSARCCLSRPFVTSASRRLGLGASR